MDKQRYAFAMSCFARSCGINVTNNEDIKQFCKEWSSLADSAPLDETTDQYFYYEYKRWKKL